MFNLLKIKELIEQKKISKETFAQQIGLKKQTFYNYINGSTKIPAEILEKIAKALGISVCYFFDEDCNKNGTINNGGIQVNGNNRIDIKLNQKDNEIEKLKIQLESSQNENKKTLELVDELRQRLIDKDELIEMLKEKM